MRHMKTPIITVAVICVLGLAGFYYAPYLALKEIKNAAQAGNAEELAECVDFPAVRESIKGSLKASMMRKMAEDDTAKDNPFAPLGMMMAGALIDPMVEAFVSPSRIAGLM